MALIKPEQLRSGSYNITGSFSGSFYGDGSGLNNLPSSNINTSSLATTGSNTFSGNQTVSGSIYTNGTITFSDSAFISNTAISGSTYISTLNAGTLHLNDDGGEGDILILNGQGNKLRTRGDVEITGSIYLGSGSIISESGSHLILTPPTASPGQSLVLRPTQTWNLTSDHPNGFTPGDLITITFTPNIGGAYTFTASYTFTDCTEVQLGRSLTGSLDYVLEESKSLSWTIPSISDITSFTFTVENVAFPLSPNPFITLTRTGSINNEPSHLHLISGDPLNVDLYLGDDDQYVKIEKNAGNVVIGTNLDTHQWIFDTSGSLTVPGNISGALNLATTGSNTFRGIQIISGSEINTILQVHGANAEPWAFGIYNDTYSSSQPGLAGWVDNTGEANIGTEDDKPLYIYTNATYNTPTLIISSSGVTIANTLTVNNGITGSLHGTSSYALSASYAVSASYEINYETSSSYAETASIAESASYALTSSYVLQAVSASYATTASYALNGGGGVAFPYTGSALITGSLTVTGSLNVTAGITGSLLGTSSYAAQALSSSFATTASYVLNAVSASFATTASYIPTIKSFSASVASFSGNPYSASVTFGTAYPNNLYGVSITGEDSRAWSISGKTSTGFTINSNSSVALTGPVYWTAIPF